MRPTAPRIAAAAGLLLAGGVGLAHARRQATSPAASALPGSCVFAVAPKPLSGNVTRGLDWLVSHQHDSGGWGQGDEAPTMQGNRQLASAPNVADTCISTLALLRSGESGRYAQALHRGIGYVCGQVEASDEQSLSITTVQGTRVQSKLGPYIDTFLASVVLAESKGRMPDDASEQRLAAALQKVLRKIERNQKDDGTWDNNGWAPVLAQSMAAKGLNRAAQLGEPVDGSVLAKIEGVARDQSTGAGGAFAAPGSAGVALYGGAASLSTLQDSVNSNRQREDEVRKTAETAESKEDRAQAQKELDRFADAEEACTSVRRAIVDRLEDERFIAGFGSNGGEEFLSYMNIGESLVLDRGNDWTRWDESMTKNLNRIQNQDGSWTGHHCITGRTFCTATALLVLMVDRTPVPAEALAAE